MNAPKLCPAAPDKLIVVGFSASFEDNFLNVTSPDNLAPILLSSFEIGYLSLISLYNRYDLPL